jgi:hypothetical protein
MSVVMVQAKVKKESVPEVDQAVGRMFGAIECAQPKGVQYASTRVDDGQTYVACCKSTTVPRTRFPMYLSSANLRRTSTSGQPAPRGGGADARWLLPSLHGGGAPSSSR